MKKENLGLLFATFTAILWGFLALFLKFSLVDFDSISIVWFRFTFSFLFLFLLVFFKKREYIKIFKKPPLLIIIAGIALGLNYYYYMEGLKYTNPTISSIIIQFGPVLLAAVGVFIYKEKVSFRQILGYLIVISGFGLFYYDQVSTDFVVYKDLSLGVIVTLIAAVFWVIYASFQKQLSKVWEPQQLNLIIYLLPIFMFAPFVNYESFLNLTIESIVVLSFLGINTLLGYGFVAEALKYAPANKVSVIITLNPIITLIAMAILDKFNYIWLGKETTTMLGYFAALMVIMGAILAIYKGK